MAVRTTAKQSLDGLAVVVPPLWQIHVLKFVAMEKDLTSFLLTAMMAIQYQETAATILEQKSLGGLALVDQQQHLTPVQKYVETVEGSTPIPTIVTMATLLLEMDVTLLVEQRQDTTALEAPLQLLTPAQKYVEMALDLTQSLPIATMEIRCQETAVLLDVLQKQGGYEQEEQLVHQMFALRSVEMESDLIH